MFDPTEEAAFIEKLYEYGKQLNNAKDTKSFWPESKIQIKWQRNVEDDRSVPANPINGNSCVLEKEGSQVSSFGLMTPASELSHSNSNSVGGDTSSGSFLLCVEVQSQPQPQQHMQQNPRKQWRCWSSELHRHFVDALQQPSGAQAATPKQIRELMQTTHNTIRELSSFSQTNSPFCVHIVVSAVNHQILAFDSFMTLTTNFWFLMFDPKM
ncbi:hypothetical protein JHK82_048390 [Glycine max]|nr:hypothetical protein JHK82_048390 [Glycine max]